ncbi:MAG: hypothetical protein HC895_06820 [Leptolyngbyaceae cyanobacterium SM1_3_5]|nr:hypothetical protein [Leptolyngbyaceae cyanobacterium SM1_3_5]
MNKIISAVKKLRIERLLAVCFAGLLLLFTTACNGAANATKPPTSTTSVERAREDIRPDGTTGSIRNGLSKGSGVAGTDEKALCAKAGSTKALAKTLSFMIRSSRKKAA